MADCQTPHPGGERVVHHTPSFAEWSEIFLIELAATSNVSAAARKAKVSTFLVYEKRRRDQEFNRKWRDALCEGYEHLEMALLQRMRDGHIKPAAAAKRGTRQFDNATALRLLISHRETVARQRAIRENEDVDAILDTLNSKLEQMRERWLADDTGQADDVL